MKHPLCKFCSAEGAAKILENNCIFITSPMDLNDPFEMRPAWTQSHEDSQHELRNRMNKMVAGMPLLIATVDGLVSDGTMPDLGAETSMRVENQIGIADSYTHQVSEFLHNNFRILSLVKNVIDTTKEFSQSRSEETLMWAHYADMFQGVGILIDPRYFNIGERPEKRKRGFTVKYQKGRIALPVWFYHALQGWSIDISCEMESELEDRLFALLTTKSRLWKYEQEARMVYNTKNLTTGKDFTEIHDACPACRQRGIPLEKCQNPVFRDAVKIPAKAIVGVVFGAECTNVEQLLSILKEDRYKHVKLYWSALSGHDYHVDYLESSANDIAIFQRAHAERVAMAKGHVCYSKDGGETIMPFAALKGINFTRGPSQ
jgi:hypothetical protein